MAPPLVWRSADGLAERTLLTGSPAEPAAEASTENVTQTDASGRADDLASVCGADPKAGFAALCLSGAECRLSIEPESSPAGLDLSDPAVSVWVTSERPVVLGEADTELDRQLEKIVLTMRPGDCCRAAVKLLLDRLPDKVAERLRVEGAEGGGSGPQEVTVCLKLTVVSATDGRRDHDLSSQERVERGEAARRRGNVLFAAGRVVDAFFMYRRALSLLLYAQDAELEESARQAAAAGRLACRANLAACHLRRNRPEAARAAATRVLNEQPDHVRCLYRRGAANLALQDLEMAERDFGRLLQLEPGNAAAARQMALLQKRRKELDLKTANFMAKYFQTAGRRVEGEREEEKMQE